MDAMDLAPAHQASFLDAECGDDSDLRENVERLVKADTKSGDTFARAIGEVAGELDAPVSEQISHYRILEKLGEGGMGVVYKAQDTKLGRFVALKFLAPHLLRDSDARKRFEREARAAAALDHPNICTCHEIDEADGRTFIALAFLDGQTLSSRIAEGPLAVSDVRTIAGQLAKGLEAAHAQGVVHRDMKPDNVMLVYGSQRLVKIMDFGLAQLAGSSQLTVEGSTMGTIAYMSPEQARGDEVDQRSDIWSLGAMLYEMVAGRRPFRGEVDQAIIYSILHEEPTPFGEDVPQDLARIVAKALAKSPESRYQNLGELLGDLGVVRNAPLVGPQLRKRAARRKATPAQFFAFAGMICALTAFGFLVLSKSPPGPAAVSEPMDAIQFTSFPGIEMGPSFSPDGNQIAFNWNGENQDNWDIYVKVVGPGRALRLTTNENYDHTPAWSPDDLSIAFIRSRSGVEKVAVHVIPALGGQERKVAEINEPVFGFQTGNCLDWSPDGRWLVVCDAASPLEPMGLFLVSIDSGEMRPLTTATEGAGDLGPAFSPDGRTLVFARFQNSFTSDLYLLELADDLTPRGEPRRRTFLERRSTSPAFTADGRDIVFASGGASGGLWRVPVQGSDPPQKLPFVGEHGEDVTISRQGNRMAFVEARGNMDIWRVSLPVENPETPEAVRLIASTNDDEYPRYSPKGSQIAYQSRGSGTLEIWKSDADGSNSVQLTALDARASSNPRWSPDGERILFASDAEGQFDIYVINADGGAPRRLTSDPSPEVFPWWSRDGEWIYYSSRNASGFRQLKMPAAGGEPIDLGTAPGVCWSESADGKFVYCFGRDPNPILAVPAGGGEPITIIESTRSGLYDVVEDGIYFAAPSTPQSGHWVNFLRFATGAVEPVFRVEKPIAFGFSASRDGRSILFGQGERPSNIMLVENFR